MQNKSYNYQYDTNPRKIDTNYNTPRIKKAKQKKKNIVPKKKTKEQIRKEKLIKTKMNILLFFKFVLLFFILFLILFRTSKISELFSTIQNLKTSITNLQKENDQLEISIQNSLNTNHIEQAAKDLLGMQKRTYGQTVYITLPKKDYVEHRTEEVIIEEDNRNIFQKIFDKLFNGIN